MKRFLLVSLGVFYKFQDGKPYIFMQKREEEGALKGKWELPGGKIELGEGPIDALIREMKEELSVDVKPSEVALMKLTHHEYPETNVILYVYVINKAVEFENWFELNLEAEHFKNIPEANFDIFRDLERFFGPDPKKFKQFEKCLWLNS